ncbi:SAM-dependent methyltransferase [Myxococcus landrumensis]|uniref:S-adenosyl-L-methionine-dependent methyltransferase n=1 Tax=Myxococcus landrumensis TaxID=2813577 RepID=A0ABX7N7W7_9BACT|nr:SAM-dependent methyltransferase [Myxococcus landrumus]QSQ14852.1 SAM-dependent methyltransferase [Myxococcus landrumus]
MNKDKRQADRTALGVAMWRALGAREEDSRVRNPDFMAEDFLDPVSRLLLSVAPVRAWFKSHFGRKLPGAYGFATARTLHLDSLFQTALDDGAQQVVLLGAGYDSRAYRFRERLEGVRVFEVDLPSTQRRKKERLSALLGAVPDWVTYVPSDFDAHRLEDVLPASGFDSRLRTFFLWEGVSMYLTEQGVRRTLGFVVRNTPRGSSIAFDYVALGALRGDVRYPNSRQWGSALAAMGHPMTFGIEEDDSAAYLREQGLELLSSIGSADMEREYLRKSNGELLCHTSNILHIVHARVA